MTETEEPGAGPARSVAERAFAVLLAFDDQHRSMTLSQIARRTGLPVATTHRLLHRLEGMAAVERDAQGAYSIGALIWRLGILAPAHDVIGRGGRPLLTRLGAQAAMDVRAYTYFDSSAMCVEEVLLRGGVSPGGPGAMVPLAGSAAGVAIASRLPDDALTKLPLTRGRFEELLGHVAAARSEGLARLTTPAGGELAVPLDVVGRPPMALCLTPPLAGARGAETAALPTTRPTAPVEAALRAAGRALRAILNRGAEQ
ncbi:helix-turn-helix domain-containing protein [Sinomonas flava]|uniref:helix-turn-helix domain-containing protein n=1 Tax=Sinomonas flava TaxID=496857 RepID=UPI0039A5FEFF